MHGTEDAEIPYFHGECLANEFIELVSEIYAASDESLYLTMQPLSPLKNRDLVMNYSKEISSKIMPTVELSNLD